MEERPQGLVCFPDWISCPRTSSLRTTWPPDTLSDFVRLNPTTPRLFCSGQNSGQNFESDWVESTQRVNSESAAQSDWIERNRPKLEHKCTNRSHSTTNRTQSNWFEQKSTKNRTQMHKSNSIELTRPQTELNSTDWSKNRPKIEHKCTNRTHSTTNRTQSNWFDQKSTKNRTPVEH